MFGLMHFETLPTNKISNTYIYITIIVISFMSLGGSSGLILVDLSDVMLICKVRLVGFQV